MKSFFKHNCSRRSAPVLPVPVSAGSGGGPVVINDMEIENPQAEGGHTETFDATYSIAANRIEFIARPPLPPSIPDDFLISFFSAGMGTDGRVEIGGSQGVRITAGPPMLPPNSSKDTNGVEIIVGENQEINLQRGLIEGFDQQILMSIGSIVVDGGAGTVMVKSLTSITLQVADGLSSITMTPEGITIQGLLVMIN